MIRTNRDFVATVYKNNSERIRKIATVDPTGLCIRLRRGSPENLAEAHELYLDSPYILQTMIIRNANLPNDKFDPKTPVDENLRPNTILRFASNLHTIPANFRHEFHYENELHGAEQIAKQFKNKFML
jgi:hypothetical protein